MNCLFCNDLIQENDLVTCCTNNHTSCNKCWKHWVTSTLSIYYHLTETELDCGVAYPLYGGGYDEIYCPTCGLKSNVPKNGTYLIYNMQGGKQFEVNYKDNKKHGIYRTYHPIRLGNKIESEQNYINGVREGIYVSKHSNGVTFMTNKFVNGKIEGTRILNDNDGNIYMKEEYKNGLLNIQTMYNKDGTKREEYLLHDGMYIK